MTIRKWFKCFTRHFQMLVDLSSLDILIQISLNFELKGPVDNKSALLQETAWPRTGAETLPEIKMILFNHSCISFQVLMSKAQMYLIMTSSNVNIFRVLALCAGNSPVTGEFPTQKPVTRSFDVFFDLRLNKRLSKHSRGWWFKTPSCPIRRHCNV